MAIQKTHIVIFVASFAAGVFTCSKLFPRIETQIKLQEKEVVRTDVKTVTRTVERPDGTKETVTETTDKSVAKSDKNASITKFAKPQWLVGISAKSELDELQPVYELQVSRRIIGPLFAGVTANTSGEIGILLQGEF
jgi:hypothetical protein